MADNDVAINFKTGDDKLSSYIQEMYVKFGDFNQTLARTRLELNLAGSQSNQFANALAQVIQQERQTQVMEQAKNAVKGMTEAEKSAVLAAKQLAQEEQNLQKTQQNTGRGFIGMFTEINSAINLIQRGIGVAKSVMDFANTQASIQYTQEKFDRLTVAIGTTSSALMNKLRAATHGTVSDLQLMTSATGFLTLGLVKTEDQAVRLTRVAGAMGMDINQLTLTLTNQTTRRFDSLGMSVDGFAERLATLKSAGMDTNSAFTEAFLQQAEAQIQKVGDIADTTAGKIKQADTSWQNYLQTLKTGQGGGIAKALVDVEIGSGNVVKALTDMSNGVRDGTITMAQGRLEFARWILGSKSAAQTSYELENGLYGLTKAEQEDILLQRARQAAYDAVKSTMQNTKPAFQGYEEDLAKVGKDTKVGKLDVSGILQNLDEISKKYDGLFITMGKFDRQAAGQQAMAILNKQFQDGLIDLPEYEKEMGLLMVKTQGLSGDQAMANIKQFEWLKMLKDGTLTLPQYLALVQGLDDAINHVPKDVQINFNLTTTGDIPNLGHPQGTLPPKPKTPAPAPPSPSGPPGPPEFASGTPGWMTVPPGYPNDSYTVRMSSGEQFNVKRPGQGSGGGGDITVNVYPSPGMDEMTLASAAASKMQRAKRMYLARINSGIGYAGS
jgi:hypothetical protein